MTDAVVAETRGRAGWIVLDRPKALNALNVDMIRGIRAALERFATDQAVQCIVIEGAGGRAFCAGGDVRQVRADVLAGRHDAVEAFFASEYALNAAIARSPKPWIALVDGICMGGGLGLSVHGDIRVATEHAAFAMPETAIALFPDVGMTYVLPRLSGAIGTYLALTGARLTGGDAVHAGLATHYVRRDDLGPLAEALAANGVAAVSRFAATPPPFALRDHRAAIDRCFSANGIGEIRERLGARADDWADHWADDWAHETIKTLDAMSPSSLVWSLAALRRGARDDLETCLRRELRLTRLATRHHDFAEGVRAAVVDKDRTPRWSPANIEDVDLSPIMAVIDAD